MTSLGFMHYLCLLSSYYKVHLKQFILYNYSFTLMLIQIEIVSFSFNFLILKTEIFFVYLISKNQTFFILLAIIYLLKKLLKQIL